MLNSVDIKKDHDDHDKDKDKDKEDIYNQIVDDKSSYLKNDIVHEIQSFSNQKIDSRVELSSQKIKMSKTVKSFNKKSGSRNKSSVKSKGFKLSQLFM